jgi:nitrate reductase (NAD(P)H)
MVQINNTEDFNQSMVKRTGQIPINAEPLHDDVLKNHITKHHYIRNHGLVPDIEDYTLEIEDKQLTIEQIKSYPSVDIMVTMACDGNRRGQINKIRRSNGFDWGPLAVSTARWQGVLLRDVLLDLFDQDKLKQYNYVHFESFDSLTHGNYGSHLPIPMVLDIYADILLAYGMNGEQLPPNHGYPLRTILPGCVGGRTVKWLKKITLSKDPSSNWYQRHDNKVLPPNVINDGLASQYWDDDRYTLYHLNVNSAILKPWHNENVSITQSDYTISGYAYDGGGRCIIRVEISLDDGDSWINCAVKYPDNYQPRHQIRYWVMCKWSVNIPLWKLGSEIVVRAWNDSFNTQPEKATWNLLGMMNNSWYRVKVKRTSPESITFIHDIPDSKINTIPIGVPNRIYSWKQVQSHKAWVVIDRVVYDLTDFLDSHPGGSASILAHSGMDVTSIFASIHSDSASAFKDSYAIGYVSDKAVEVVEYPNKTDDGHTIGLKPRKWIDVKLIKKQKISPDTRRFIFAFSDFQCKMWLPWGKHIKLAIFENDDMIIRPYTPVKPILKSEDDGTFELVIKIYFPHDDKPGGAMTQKLEQLAIGDTIRVKGPEGHINYLGNGNFVILGGFVHCCKINFIVGGTGITPALAVIRAIVLAEANREIQISLVYANKTTEDILCLDELNQLSEHIKIFHVISSLKEPAEQYHSGRINYDILKSACFEAHDNTLCLICGPPGMIANAVFPNLQKLGHDDNHIFEF